MSQCRVLIAVIGDQWIERGSAVGKRRIDDSRDQLRVELEVALSRNIPVIPVLVRKASVPTEEELPPSLKSLAYGNGIQVRPDPDFSGDMDRLIKGIEPHLTSAPLWAEPNEQLLSEVADRYRRSGSLEFHAEAVLPR